MSSVNSILQDMEYISRYFDGPRIWDCHSFVDLKEDFTSLGHVNEDLENYLVAEYKHTILWAKYE